MTQAGQKLFAEVQSQREKVWMTQTFAVALSHKQEVVSVDVAEVETQQEASQEAVEAVVAQT